MATVTKFVNAVVVADVEVSGELIGKSYSRSGIVHFDTRYSIDLKTATGEVSIYDATGLDEIDEDIVRYALLASARYEAQHADLKQRKLEALDLLVKERANRIKAKDQIDLEKRKSVEATPAPLALLVESK